MCKMLTFSFSDQVSNFIAIMLIFCPLFLALIFFSGRSCLSYFMTLALMAVRQEVNSFESSVVVQKLEFAMNLVLYGLL